MGIDAIKDSIHTALVRAMETTDVDKLSVVALCKAAHVSRATFYRRYESVDDVLKEMEDTYLEDMRDLARYFISSGLDQERLTDDTGTMTNIFTYIYEHRDFYLAVTGPHGDQRFAYRTQKLLREFYGGKLAFEGLMKEHADFAMVFSTAGHTAIIRYWLKERTDIPPQEMKRIVEWLMFGSWIAGTPNQQQQSKPYRAL